MRVATCPHPSYTTNQIDTTDPNVRNPAEAFLRRAEEGELVRRMDDEGQREALFVF